MIESNIDILALIWVSHVFIFTECDKVLDTLFNRCIYSLSIESNGAFNQTQYNIKKAMSFQELIDLGKAINKHSRAENNAIMKFNKFTKQYQILTEGKNILIINLLILTVHTICKYYFTYYDEDNLFLIHLVSTLFLFIAFYADYHKSESVEFTTYNIDPNANFGSPDN